VALGTGFRAGELRSLTPESFHLDPISPSVTVAAAYSKRRRDDIQPIRPALAEALLSWIATKCPATPVFGPLSKHTNLMIRADLERAGLAYRDSSGRVADFHSLRHSFITTLAMSRAPVKVVQSLARHSTPTLTLGTYSHVGLHDQAGALEALPDLTSPPSDSEPTSLAATGTDGATHKKTLAPHLIHVGDGECRNLADRDATNLVGEASNSSAASIPNRANDTALDVSSRLLTDADGAEGEGFEPPGSLRTLRFSRPSQSATLAPLRCDPGPGHWPTSLRTSSETKIGTSTVTATAIASLGRESTSIKSPSWRMRSLAK
jgi:hypothetical protein